MNGIAILDRTFLDMEILKPILCASSLLGIHFTRPFLSLLLDTSTNYETLMKKFPIFYNDLNEVDVTSMLQTSTRVAEFIDDEKFKMSLPKPCLLETINTCAIQYKEEVSIQEKFFQE